MLSGSRVTGLELTQGRLIAVELSRGAVSRALSIEPPDLEPTRLAVRLAQAGLATSRMHLVGWDSSHIHRTMLLPRMASAERTRFLERELSRGEDGQARVFAAQVVRQVREGVATKDDVLVAAGPREAFQRLMAPLTALRVTPALVTTAPLALVSAVGALVPDALRRPAVVVYYGAVGLTIAVAADGVLRLARQLPRLAELDPVEWMGAEIERSTRQYSQIAKGERVEDVYLGAAVPLGGLTPRASLERGLDLPVVDLNEAMELRVLEGGGETPALAAGALLLAFGAATLAPARTVNLLPPEVLRARGTRRLVRGGLVAAAAVGVVVAAATSSVSREATALRAELDRVKRTGAAAQAHASETARIQGEREQIRRWLDMLADDPLRGAILTDTLKEISRLVPDDVRLDVLALTRTERGYGVRLAGAVVQAELAEAQTTFNRLYFDLRRSPLFHDVAFSLVKPIGAADPKGPPRLPITFEVTLGIKGIAR